MEPLSGRKSLTDEVHDRLVDALCSGALPPGTPLRQEAIAEELNVSRQPVLQALGLLRRDGLVEPMGRRGYRVAPVDSELVRHVYDLREAFDGLAARLAAQSNAPDRESALRAAIEQGRHALGSGDTAELVAADVAFHQTARDSPSTPLTGWEDPELAGRNARRYRSGLVPVCPMTASNAPCAASCIEPPGRPCATGWIFF